MPLTKEQVLEALKAVKDPELHRDVVTLGMVQNVAVCEGYINVKLSPPEANDRSRAQLASVVKAVIKDADPELDQVNVEFAEAPKAKPAPPKQAEDDIPGPEALPGEKRHALPQMKQSPPAEQQQPQQQRQAPPGAAQGGGQNNPQDEARQSNPLPQVKQIIAVGAGKGGVGKSTIAVNLAVGLARLGKRVGILDGDIYGPSLPTLMGMENLRPEVLSENRIKPFEAHAVQIMTLGKLVEEEKPLIWRGPMAHGAFRQLATQTAWSDLDYLIIDLPPGTGDVPLTMAQLLPLSGAVVVCTPQKVAQDDAVRAVRMFEQLGIPVLGIVENMSYFIGDDGKEYDIFGRGGAQVMAQKMGLPFLGAVPINMRLRTHSDQGNPTANFENDAQLGESLEAMVKNVMGQATVQAMDGPTLDIH